MSLDNDFISLPIAPFIIDLLSKSSPNINLWKASDLLNKPAPIPVTAPRIGPPGKKNEANAPATAPFLTVPACSPYKSINFLGITPPVLFPSSSKSPNIHCWNVSDCFNKLVPIPTTTAPNGPPGNIKLPNIPPTLAPIAVLIKPDFNPSLNALGILSLIFSVNLDIVSPALESALSPNKLV